MTTDFYKAFFGKTALQLPPPKKRISNCEPLREVIELGLSRERNAMAIWQNLIDSYGFGGAYNTVKRFICKLRGVRQPQQSGIIITAPGEEAQVDYGTGPMGCARSCFCASARNVATFAWLLLATAHRLNLNRSFR